MKKKLLFVVDERLMGGVSVVLLDLLNFLVTDKYQITVLVLHNRGNMLTNLNHKIKLIYGTAYFDTIDYPLKEVLRMKSLPKLLKKLRIIFDLKTGLVKKRIKKERKKILNESYDVEIAFKDGYSAIFTAFGDTTKKIHWLHCDYYNNNPNLKYPKLFQKVLSKFDYIVGVATNVTKSFNEVYPLAKAALTIPIAMDTKRIISLSSNLPNVKIAKDKLNIVVVGRAHPVKGYQRMIEVFDMLNQEKLLSDVSVHVFGDGPLFLKIKTLIENKNLSEIVLMEGNVENPYAEIKQYDFLLLPSYSEAFGTVISEAKILHVPVLATRTSASEMSIEDSKTGWICDNSTEGIYQMLKSLLKNREKINKCKNNLANFKYDNSQILKDIKEIL
ncbi:MAG: glycosyltransferase [Erysipelotrichaceae bacterium]